VREVAAYSTLAMTVGLVLARPRVTRRLRIGPATAALTGVALMMVVGAVGPADLLDALRVLWKPFVTITAIMLTTAIALKLGILDRLAARIEPLTRGPVHRSYAAVFLLSALTSALLNNDAAVLLLTPLIVALVKRLYPLRQYLVVPYAFAVFAAAGVAPLVISNPMNLIVADRRGIGFNEYARWMAPVSLIGWLASFLVLRQLFCRELDDEIPARGPEREPLPPMQPGTRRVILLLAIVLFAYPVISYFNGPVWAVAASGAALALLICVLHRSIEPRDLARSVSWEVLPFLFGVFVIATGLKNAGAVALLSRLYAAAPAGPAQVGTIGLVSSVGSALLNNHPMAILNALALDGVPAAGKREVLAALVGGDLGPRLLPMGSLAGLLWMESLRRQQVDISLKQFVRVGVWITVPTLLVSLFMLCVR
jgi:arsenical pump membrane protein